jgi:hypothetical protein
MFQSFFYQLKEQGIPVSLTSFLRLQKALSRGLILSINDFYTAARAILIKSEKYFDLYDRIFARVFEGAEMPELPQHWDDEMERLLKEWLSDPKERKELEAFLQQDPGELTPDELMEYFRKRLSDQKERHDGGNKWIGTAGTSPVGHSGHHPGGMRVGGSSQKKSAIKTALDRRYKDYNQEGPLTESTLAEAMKRLRNMVPHGPKDRVDVDETIYNTMRKAGEIEIIFRQSLKDKIKILLLIDNGGYSMDPYVHLVQLLFDHAKSQFKELRVMYFHNTIYTRLWEDAARYRKTVAIEEICRLDPETRLIIVGDASMSPYELLYPNGAIEYGLTHSAPGLNYLRILAAHFPHHIWLNPVRETLWEYTKTIGMIKEVIPMFELSLEGLEKGVIRLMSQPVKRY